MDSAQEFFYVHAGYSFDPKTETSEDGRRRGALALARAEGWGTLQGWETRWEDDWSVGSHVKFYGSEGYPSEPDSCETAFLEDSEGTVLASLSCIDGADGNYRRVISAELVLEAMDPMGTVRRVSAEYRSHRSKDPDISRRLSQALKVAREDGATLGELSVASSLSRSRVAQRIGKG